MIQLIKNHRRLLGTMTILASLAATSVLWGADSDDIVMLEKVAAPPTSVSTAVAIPTKPMRVLRSEGFFYEDFEKMENGSLADGWITTATPGNTSDYWSVGTLGAPDPQNPGQTSIIPGTSGTKYAFILGNRNSDNPLSHDAWLFSPVIEMDADHEYIIEFCAYMATGFNTTEELEVSVHNSQNPDDIIQLIDHITDNDNHWKLYSYTFTPAESGNYYLGFHSLSQFSSNATLLDDVKVSSGPTAGFLGMAAIHGGFTDMRKGTISTSYDVMNNGKAPLELGVKDTSPEISVSGLPMTVPAGRSGEVIISFTPSEPGNKWSYVTFTTSDPAHPEVTVAIYTETADVPVTAAITEDFEHGRPAGWALAGQAVFTDFYPGHNGARCYYTRSIYTLSEEGPIGFTTNYVEMGEEPHFSFWYKLTDCDLLGHLGTPTAEDTPVMQILVSEDNGWTYTPVWELGQDSGRLHNPSAEFQKIDIPLPEYKNKVCRIKFEIWNDKNPLENDFIILVDDVEAGTKPAVDLRASALRGSNLIVAGQNGTLSADILNLGSAASDETVISLSDSNGNEVGSATVSTINPGETLTVSIPYVCEQPGAYTMTATVKAENDNNPADNITNALPIAVVPAEAENVTIGKGKNYMSLIFPVYFGNYETATQTVYTANEIGSDCGEINSISWTSLFAEAGYTETFEVFIGETDREDYSDEGWVPESELTKVFEGNFFIPSGQYDLTIPFDRPFEYHGRNLVVMTRKISDEFIVTRRFLTHTADTKKSIYCAETARGIMVPGGYANRMSSFEYPHATFNVLLPPNGTVTGKITDSNGAIKDAKVYIEGTLRYTFSDSQGNYELHKVRTGTRSVGVTNFAYYPSEGNTVEVTDRNESVRDIVLTAYPKSTLSGTARNHSGEPIAEARVYMTGYADFMAVTDTEGRYKIEGIYSDTGVPYDIRVKSAFFNTHHNKALTVNNDMTYDMELSDTPLRVHNLQATGNDGTVDLTWQQPVTEFSHDSGVPDTYLGWNHGHSHTGIFSVYPEHINVREIRFYVTDSEGPHANFNVLIFGLDENGYPDPENILYMAKKIPYEDNAWTSHILKTPIEVNGCAVCVNCDLFLGLGATKADEEHPFSAGMHFFAGDEYMAEDGIIDFTHFDDVHPMLRIGGDYLGEAAAPARITRPAVSYELYRHESDRPDNGTFIGSTTELSFTDIPTADVSAGKYRYSAVACYATEEAEPVMSNEIDYTPSAVAVISTEHKVSVVYSPADGLLTLSDPTAVAALYLTDMSGKIVLNTDNISTPLCLSGLEAGAYVVTLKLSDGSLENHKIIIH